MAGKLTLNPVQINDSATATNNFVLKADNLGGLKLSRGNDGATLQEILDVAPITGVVTLTQGSGRMVLGTAQATTSGTSIDFTGIPSWVKRITVMLNGISLSGAASPRLQIGTSSGVETSGYTGSQAQTAAVVATGAGGLDVYAGTAAYVISGKYTIEIITGSTYLLSFIGGNTSSGLTYVSSGLKTVTGTLDRVRFTSTNGTDTFDAGSVNIMYEG